MDTYEASLVVVSEAGRPDAPHPHHLPVAGLRVRAVSLPDVFPQAFVSQREAKAACEEAKKRLCTDEEWALACEGAEAAARTYPYGAPYRAGACNDAAPVSPLAQTLGPRAAGTGYRWEEMNDPRLGLVPGALAKTGAHPACRTPEGVVDLVGNLHEWTDDPGGTFRGGFYLDTKQHGEGCAYVTTAHDASYRDYSIGFRCCAATAP